MSERVTMPALGESVTEGTVTRWLKNVGDQVAVDEPLLEVSTDKVDTEIPSPVAGSAAGDPRPGGRHGAGRRRPRGHRRRCGRRVGGESARRPPRQPAEPRRRSERRGAARRAVAAAAPTSRARAGSVRGTRRRAARRVRRGSGAGETVTMPALGESRHRRHRHPLAEGRGRRRRGRRAAARGLDRQGRHRDPLAGRRQADQDPRARRTTPCRSAPTWPSSAASPAAAAGSARARAASRSPQAPEPAPRQPKPSRRAAGRPAQDAAEPAKQPEPAQAARAGPDRSRPGQHGAAPRRRRRRLRDPAGPQARQPARRRPGRRSPAPASVAGSASRTCSTPPRRPRPPLLPPAAGSRLPRPRRHLRPPAPPASPPAASSVSPKRGTTEKMTRLRKVIATRMVESLQVSAQLTTVVEVDLTKVARLRAKRQGRVRGPRGREAQLPAVPRAGRRRGAQGAPDGQREHRGRPRSSTTRSENLSIAVDTEKGLHRPGRQERRRPQHRRPRPGDRRRRRADPRRTRSPLTTWPAAPSRITNTGSRGALFDTPIINQPQVAILGTGALVKRPVVVTDADGGETIAIRSMMYLALTYDHRIVDGADAARFLGDDEDAAGGRPLRGLAGSVRAHDNASPSQVPRA